MNPAAVDCQLQIADAARVAPLDKLRVVILAVIAAPFAKKKLSGANGLDVAMIAAPVRVARCAVRVALKA